MRFMLGWLLPNDSPRREPCAALARAGALGLLGVIATSAPAARAGVTGVCPDGSVFVVRSARDVPCSGAKHVDPHDVPPLRPEYLPRPYTWEVYQEGADPNNPYNLIDAARQVRALQEDGASPPPAPDATPSEAEAALAAPPGRAAAPAPGAIDLGLGEADLRDLFHLVELSQQAAPAAFTQQTADGRERLRIALAHSRAFEARLREADRSGAAQAAGPVIVFTAVARQAERFESHFTFVQGHLAFHPETSDPAQLGVVQGHLGDLDPGEVVLGYAVLPESMDVRQPMDVYWHDRRVQVTFQP